MRHLYYYLILCILVSCSIKKSRIERTLYINEHIFEKEILSSITSGVELHASTQNALYVCLSKGYQRMKEFETKHVGKNHRLVENIRPNGDVVDFSSSRDESVENYDKKLTKVTCSLTIIQDKKKYEEGWNSNK